MNVRMVLLRRGLGRRVARGGWHYRLGLLALTGWLSCGLCGSAPAQEAAATNNAPALPPGGAQQEFAPANAFVPRAANQPRLSAALDYSYVGAGDVSFRDVNGSSQAQALHLSAAGAVPVDDHWFVPLGLSVGNMWLQTVDGAPIPSRINNLRLMTGVGYWINEDWTITGSLGPSLYRLEDLDSGDVGVAGMVSAVYRARPGLTWVFGLGFNPDSDLPVLPAAGVRWDIRTNLVLNLMFPRPVLIYRLTDKLSVFGGGDFKVATFRTDEHLGDSIGHPAYNDALGTYHDFHLGLGAEYQLRKQLALSVEGGYSVGRQIHYKDIDQTVSFDPSPYGQVGLKYRF